MTLLWQKQREAWGKVEMSDQATTKKRRKWLPLTGSILGRLFLFLIGASAIALSFLYAVESAVPVHLPFKKSFYVDSWDRGYVIADGVWVLDNEKIAAPFNTTQIVCEIDQRVCREASAELMPFAGKHSLYLVTTTFAVSSWTKDTITAAASNGCVRRTMTLSRRAQSITALREPDPDGRPESCLIEMKDVIRSSVQDGFPVEKRIRAEQTAKVVPWMWGTLFVWALYMLWRGVKMAREILRRSGPTNVADN